MRTTFSLFIVALVSLIILSCNSSQSENNSSQQGTSGVWDPSWAKSFIDSTNTTFSRQIMEGDSVGLASHYWPDAELLLDNSEPFKGDKIVNAWGGAIRAGIKEMTFSNTDITGDSTFIIETGNYEMKDANKTLLDRGKYVVVWQKRNGEWKLFRDVGSTSMPLAK